MRKIDKEPGAYITLKELSDMHKIPKVSLHYYVLKGALVPAFMVGKTNLFDKKDAMKIVDEILKKQK